MRMKNPFHMQLLFCACLLLLCSSLSAEPTCRRGCTQSDNNFLKYVPGNVYEYNFDSILTVGLNTGSASGDTDDTNLKLVGVAKLFAEGNCGYTLQLGAVRVTTTKDGPVEKKLMKSIQKPVHFSMVSGRLEPELCSDSADTEYALNVKRAIISLLQVNTDTDSHEVDVFGQCATHTATTKVGNAEVVTKVRNLNNCAYREKINTGIINGLVNERAGVKSTNLFKSDYAKEAKVQNGIIDNVHLVEEYKFVGATRGGPDVHAKVVTTLKVKNAAGAAASAPATGSNSVSIIFQQPEAYGAKNIAALKQALAETVQLVSDYVKKNSANHFVDLIRLMRTADADTLLELSGVPQPNKVLGRKVYLDALFRTGTAESAKAIIKQINKMSDQEKTFALLSLNLVQTVDRDLITQAASLLTPNAQKEAFLAVGHVVAKYCQQNVCKGSDVVDMIGKRFVDSLKHCRANTKRDEERVIYALKGIGNTQDLEASLAPALTECASTGRSTRIRVAALQAFSAAICEGSVQAKALEILRDRNEDSELRIEAFLALIECPNAQLANDIAEIVNSETVYQVGGFITSTLTAIRDSTDSTRESQRHFLGNIRVTKQFPKDFRRYSFNNELSYRFDALGSSASADYKLIYSQHGFLPRSARLNVTTEVFGTNFNVFEASVRQENLENVLEYYVGPKGLLNKGFDEIIRLIEGGDADGGRAKRSIAEDTAKVAKRYKTFGSKNTQDLNLDLSLKLFGSEMMFLSLGDNIPSSLDDIISFFSTFVDKTKNELNNFNKEFIVHSFFMDSELVYPTGSGVPLELHSQGFAANKLDFGVSINVKEILEQNWQNAEYRFKFVPSVDINVDLQFGFDAYVLATGLRVQSSLHSATGSEIKVNFINDGSGFNADIVLPREKLELVDLQVGSDFFVAEQDKPIRSIALAGSKKHKNDNSDICFNQLETVGINICFSTNIPQTMKPSGGAGDKTAVAGEDRFVLRPFNFNMYITTERNFNLRGVYNKQTANGAQQWKLDFSTPGSRDPHDTSLLFELGTQPKTYGRIAFDNQQLHFALEAGVNNDNNEVVAYAQYEHDKEIKKNRIGFVKNGNEYRPVIEIHNREGVSNDINGYRVDGRVVVEESGPKQARYNFENVQVSNRDNERVVVNGWADVGPTSVNSEMRIAPGKHSYQVKAHGKLENGAYSAGLFVNDEATPNNVMGGSMQLQFSEEHVNVALLGMGAQWEVKSATDVVYVIPESSEGLPSVKFNDEITVKYKNNVVGSFKLNGLNEGRNKMELHAEVAQSKNVGALTVKFNSNERNKGDYTLEVNGKMNKHFVDLVAKCDVNANRFVIDNVLSTSWGTLMTVKGELGQRYTAQDIHIDLQGVAQVNGKEKPIQWILKIIGAPEKTSTEFKLSRENADLVKVNGDVQHPQDKVTAGKMNLNVKNVLVAKIEGKVAKNGKGEIVANLETQKTEPKHNVELNAKFHVQAPKYDVEAVLVLDGDKKVFVKTENVVDKLKFSTKNAAEVGGKKYSFDANGLIKGDWRMNGEVQGNFACNCPTGRIIDGSLKRKLTTNQKTGVSQGSMELTLNDQLPSSQKQSVTANCKVDKFNVKTKEFSFTASLAANDYNGRKVDISMNGKHLPKGQNKMIEIGLNFRDDNLPAPIELKVSVDEYSVKHAIFRANGNYGSTGQMNVNGNYHLGDRATPSTYEIQGSLNVPKTAVKNIELKSNGKFLRPETDAGTYVISVHVDERAGEAQSIKFDTLWKLSRQQGVYNMALETNQMQGPLKFDGSYQREETGSIREGNASGKQKFVFDISYADKYAKTSADVSYVGTDKADLHYTLDTSSDAAKDIDVVISAHKMDDDNYAMTMQAKQSGNNYAVDSKIYRSSYKKGFDVHITLPNNQPVVLIGIMDVLGSRKAKLTIEVENVIDLDFKANAEASYNNEEDFYVRAQWNSAKLNLNGFDLDVHTQGKGLTFKLVNAEGPIVQGTAGYALKKEKNKAIIEGQGQLQYKGKSQNANFRLVRQVYDLATDKEVGFSYTLNGNVGPKNGVSTLKITNREFNVKLSMCEEKKQCVNVQAHSIVALGNGEQDSDTAQHSLMMLVDLRELGYPYEFELQSKTIRQGLHLQYSLDSSIISSNNIKYQFVVNMLPTTSKLQLKLPSREILFETKQQVPEQGRIFGHYEGSAAFYFDRVNKPNEVTRFVSSADITGVENVAFNGKGEIKFEHPLIRPLTISGKLDMNREQQVVDSEIVLDVFRTPEQRIVASSHVKNIENPGHNFNITSKQQLRSDGLGFAYEIISHSALNTERQEVSASTDWHDIKHNLHANAYMFATTDRMEVIVQGLKERLLQLNGEFNRQKYSAKFNTQLQMLSRKPVHLKAELQPTYAKFGMSREGLLNFNSELKLGKEFKFNVEGAQGSLAEGRVALDAANFMQTTYKSNDEDIKAFLTQVDAEVKKDAGAAREQIKNSFKNMREMFDQRVQLFKDSAPDMSQLSANYQNNLNEIIHELENDPALAQLSETYRKIYTKLVKITGDITKMLAGFYDKFSKSVMEVYHKWELIVRDTIIPAWEQFSVTAVEVISKLRVEVIKLYTSFAQIVLGVLKEYGPALKSYGKAFNEALRPFSEALQELIKMSSQMIEEFLNEMKEYFAKLPTFEAIREEIKDKLQKMHIVEKTLEFLQQFFEQLHILPQTLEMSEFLQKAHAYLEAKLKQQPVNDEQLVEELFKLFLKAIRSVLATLEMNAPTGSVGGLSVSSLSSLLTTSLPYTVNIFSKIPELVTFRLSLFNYFLNENWDQIFSRDHLGSWVFFKDFELSGHVVDGKHIFTFDGQHFTFPANCRYILAQDSVDNNFTVVAQLNGGKVKSIVLTDRDGNFMEVSEGGALKMNGNNVEYPYHESGMHAWRRYYTVWMLSEYGVQVMCTTDLKICHVNVNGFYTSKTRGLMGNGNAEPNDDFIQIDGTLADNYAAFGNGYGLGKCAAVNFDEQSVDANQQHNEICTELFGLDSTLAIGYLMLDPRPYRAACDQATNAAAEKDKEAVACTIGTAYASALKLRNIFIMMPLRCLKCAGAAGQRDLGQEFSVKIPTNKADLVFVVDLDVSATQLNNLVAPAIREVRETLKTRGFTDVQIGVIAYNETLRYPALLTSDNGKLNYQGNIADVNLNGPKVLCDSCKSHVMADPRVLELYELIERLVNVVVPQSDEKAFALALEYPFRAGAAKSIIDVRGKTLEYGNMLKFVRAYVAGAVTKFDAALLHMIAPVQDMSVDGVPAEKLVGFNSRLIATVDGKDAKKRQKLQFNNDMGIDFVLDNGGWVFATQNFDNLKQGDQKKFLNQVTNSIADTLFKTEIVSDCRCLPMYGLHAQHKCVIKSSNFVPNKKPKAA